MQVSGPTLATVLLVSLGSLVAAPVLFQGFKRRGKGIKYERSFWIQRAPQLASVLTILLITFSFMVVNSLLAVARDLVPLFTLTPVLPLQVALISSWLGVALLFSGLIFMIGGWYSLGDCFSTDAELLDGQTVRKTGLLKYVMHPAYSGIIQSLLGASLAGLSPLSLLSTVFLVAPLWLRRAKYEERLLIDTFGQSYMDYGRELKWRRLIPHFFPIGV